MSSVPVLNWQPVVGRENNAQVLCDSTVSQTWNIALYGTAPNNELVKASHVIIDNMGNNAVVYFTYGVSRQQVAPYTRKSVPLLPDQLYVIFSCTSGIVTLTFCDFNPNIPDEVNQVATNGAGGGGVNYATLNPLDCDPHLSVYGALLSVIGASGGNQVSVRATVGKGAAKYYWEFENYDGSFGSRFGIAQLGMPLNTLLGSNAQSIGCSVEGGSYSVNKNGLGLYNVNGLPPFGSGEIWRVAVDFGATLYWSGLVSGDWNFDVAADPSTGAGGVNYGPLAGNLYPGWTVSAQYKHYTTNFGQSPFSGSAPTGFVPVST